MEKTMKKIRIFSIFIVIILGTSCASFNTYIASEEKRYFLKEYQAFDISVDMESVRYCMDGDISYIESLINNQLQFKRKSDSQNVNKLVLIVRNMTGKTPPLINAFFVGAYPLALLGMPILTQTWNVTIEGYIIDPDDNIIKKYRVTADNSEYSAIFWGYNMSRGGIPGFRNRNTLSKVTAIGAIKKCLSKLRIEIDKDFDRKTI